MSSSRMTKDYCQECNIPRNVDLEFCRLPPPPPNFADGGEKGDVLPKLTRCSWHTCLAAARPWTCTLVCTERPGSFVITNNLIGGDPGKIADPDSLLMTNLT